MGEEHVGRGLKVTYLCHPFEVFTCLFHPKQLLFKVISDLSTRDVGTGRLDVDAVVPDSRTLPCLGGRSDRKISKSHMAIRTRLPALQACKLSDMCS